MSSSKATSSATKSRSSTSPSSTSSTTRRLPLPCTRRVSCKSESVLILVFLKKIGSRLPFFFYSLLTCDLLPLQLCCYCLVAPLRPAPAPNRFRIIDDTTPRGARLIKRGHWAKVARTEACWCLRREATIRLGACEPRPSSSLQCVTLHQRRGYQVAAVFVFLVKSYSHSAYLDYGGVRFVRFSRPLSARWLHVASSPFALRPGLSRM